MKKFLLGSILLIVGCFTVTLANAFTLHNYQTGLCLGAAAGNSNPGTTIVVLNCNGTPSQQWGQITAPNGDFDQYSTSFTSSGYFYLSNGMATFSTKYFAIQGGGQYEFLQSSAVIGIRADVIANGTPLILWGGIENDLGISNYVTYNDQMWAAVPAGSDFNSHSCYVIESVVGPFGYTPYVMGVAGGSTKQGAAVILWTQLWAAGSFLHTDQVWCVY